LNIAARQTHCKIVLKGGYGSGREAYETERAQRREQLGNS
jgi:hypothetical protein